MTPSVVATSRVRRAASLTGASVQALKKIRSTDETVRRNASIHLSERLGRLRGLPQKMGQLLSMSSDSATAEAFTSLAESAAPVGLDQLLPVLAEQWGRDPGEVIKEISDEGLAASLGQVHRAVLHDGREVAIKIQYPGIRKAVQSDLKMLGWLSEPVGGLRRGFDMESYRRAIQETLEEELDYRAEAEHQRSYAAAASGLSVVVPEVIDELSSERILTTIWEAGETLAEAKGWNAERRAALARQLMKHALTMLIDHGLLHGDPHPGNYRFRNGTDEPVIVLYDYGCVRTVPLDERLVLLRLMHDTSNAPNSDPYPLFLALGFQPETLEPLRAKLPALCRVLFDPFSTSMKFDLDQWRRGERIGDILGDDRWNFRISGPARLIFLMRGFHGLIHYLRELGESVSWTQFYKPLLSRYASEMSALELLASADPCTSFGALSQHLCIRVSENGTTKVKVSLPATAVDELESVIDADVRARIETRGISLIELVRQVRVKQYAPQMIFDLEDGAKRIEVWLA